jgi:hypothetical protein
MRKGSAAATAPGFVSSRLRLMPDTAATLKKGECPMYYTGTTVHFPAVHNAVQMAFKLLSATTSAVVIVTTVENGFFVFTAPSAPGKYSYQQTDADGNVVGFGRFPVEQNLATAPANFDPRSDAEKTLEAIDAKIAGRVLTLEQSQITIGDRSITYINSIRELERWRDYYQQIVNKEQGVSPAKTEVVFLKRV